MSFGFYLYLKGTGLKRDGSKVDWGKLKFSLQTVGGVLMATSVGWAIIAQQSFPKLAQSKDGGVSVTVNPPGKAPITIYPNSIRAVASTVNPAQGSSDPALVVKTFKDALANSAEVFHVTSDTKDFKEVSVKLDPTNSKLNAIFENEKERIEVLYMPASSANGTIYVPTSATAKPINVPPVDINN